MDRFKAFSLSVALLSVAACAHGETDQDFGRGGGTPVGQGGSSNGTGGASTGSGAPTTCAEARGYAGCCNGVISYYCAKGSTTVTQKICPAGQVCGWDASKSYYACVPLPGGADPSNVDPIACQ